MVTKAILPNGKTVKLSKTQSKLIERLNDSVLNRIVVEFGLHGVGRLKRYGSREATAVKGLIDAGVCSKQSFEASNGFRHGPGNYRFSGASVVAVPVDGVRFSA